MYFAPPRKMLSVTLHTSSIFVLQHEIYRAEDVFCLHNLWQKITKYLLLADLAHPNANSVQIPMPFSIMSFFNLILTDGILFNYRPPLKFGCIHIILGKDTKL